ncbi:hypothetical protein D9758_015933 [Tetrapyrgos nigripes]|uniref:Yeast cell wall synthesis Kre9/Knh1-like N-terminal domain-containing protein n=1 Tax=Tetrapyrgos nigripes TaxID=182062 RepID=A0A8H5FHC6_9AGAR|nr:hypothetical protein D9758_015933 [Tetrapyrgos nigripes]
MLNFNKLAAFATVLAASSSVFATPVNVNQRAALSVFTPPMTSPAEGDVWVVGTQRNVTWDTSNAPPVLSNPIGQVILRNFRLETEGIANIGVPVNLVHGFDILSGSVEVTVPDVPNADDYFLNLFGDSGDTGPNFTITHSA